MFHFSPWLALSAAVPALILTLSPGLRAEEIWGTDFAAAKAVAVKNHKDILMDFTGSDWCEGCILLQKEVFSKDRFQQEAPKHFVLLKLDFPQEKELPRELQEQNDKLQATYLISVFPTILLTDETGRPYASTTYQAGGAEAFLGQLEKLRKVHAQRDEFFAKASAATGADKVKALGEGLKAMDPAVVMSYYKEELDQLIALDAADTQGFKAKRDFKLRRDKLDETLEDLALNQKTKEFTGAVDHFIATEKLTGIDLQDLLMIKLQVMGPDDLDKVDALLDEVIKVDPKSELAERARAGKEQLVQMKQDAATPKAPEAKPAPQVPESGKK